MGHPYGNLRTKGEVEGMVERRARPLRRKLAAVTADRDRLREALIEFGVHEHFPSCNARAADRAWRNGDADICRCGFAEALAGAGTEPNDAK